MNLIRNEDAHVSSRVYREETGVADEASPAAFEETHPQVSREHNHTHTHTFILSLFGF